MVQYPIDQDKKIDHILKRYREIAEHHENQILHPRASHSKDINRFFGKEEDMEAEIQNNNHFQKDKILKRRNYKYP